MVFFKGKVSVILLGVSFLVLCASLSVAKEDLQLRQCKQLCRHQPGQRQFDSRHQQECESSCEKFATENERGRGREEEEEREERSSPRHQIEREYTKCRERCQEREEGRREQQVCESGCEQKRVQQEREIFRRRGDDIFGRKSEDEEEDEEEVGGEGGKPYVFEDQHWSTKVKTEEGRVRVLKKFTKRSKLFKGIENYRVMIFEANPQTFVVPNHWDADVVLFVAQGKFHVSASNQFFFSFDSMLAMCL